MINTFNSPKRCGKERIAYWIFVSFRNHFFFINRKIKSTSSNEYLSILIFCIKNGSIHTVNIRSLSTFNYQFGSNNTLNVIKVFGVESKPAQIAVSNKDHKDFEYKSSSQVFFMFLYLSISAWNSFKTRI